MHIRHMESHLRRNINFPLIIVSGKYFDILSVFVISLPVFIRSTGLHERSKVPAEVFLEVIVTVKLPQETTP